MSSTSHIYFIQAGGAGGPIKIGRSEDPARRLAELQTAHATRLDIVLTVRGAHQVERALHHQFRRYRSIGEWFEPACELLALIQALSATCDSRLSGSLNPRLVLGDASPADPLTGVFVTRWIVAAPDTSVSAPHILRGLARFLPQLATSHPDLRRLLLRERIPLEGILEALELGAATLDKKR